METSLLKILAKNTKGHFIGTRCKERTNEKPGFFVDAQKVVCQQNSMLLLVSLQHLQELLESTTSATVHGSSCGTTTSGVKYEGSGSGQ